MNWDFLHSFDNHFVNESKVIIIDPIFRTTSFINFIKESVKSILKLNDYSYHSLHNHGCYIIITLKNNLDLVDALNVLKIIAGISYIFIGIVLKTDFETLPKRSALVFLDQMFENERYFLKVSSIIDSSYKNKGWIYSLFDLEFHIQTELSSSSHGLVKVNQEQNADRILYVIMGSKLTYVSLLVCHGSKSIPFNYFKDSIVCPFFDSISILCYLSVLKSGYKPMPIFYYINKMHLKNLFKVYEKYARKNPEGTYEFYLSSMERVLPGEYQTLFSSSPNTINYAVSENEKPMMGLSYQTLIYDELLKSDFVKDKVALPLVTFVHPVWFLNEILLQVKKSKNFIITPLLFNYPIDEFKSNLDELRELDLDIETDINELSKISRQKQNSKIFSQGKFVPSGSIIKLKTKYKKFKLKIGKDDIFDVFDSI